MANDLFFYLFELGFEIGAVLACGECLPRVVEHITVANDVVPFCPIVDQAVIRVDPLPAIEQGSFGIQYQAIKIENERGEHELGMLWGYRRRKRWEDLVKKTQPVKAGFEE